MTRLNAPSGSDRAETPAFSPPERWAQGSDGCSSDAGRARVPVVTPPDARGAEAEVLVVELFLEAPVFTMATLCPSATWSHGRVEHKFLIM